MISMDRTPNEDSDQRDERLKRVGRQVTNGQYVINAQNVAAAILERSGATFNEDGTLEESRGGHAPMRVLTFPPGA